MTVTVAIDCMGGDHGPVVTVPAALELLRQQGDVQVVVTPRSGSTYRAYRLAGVVNAEGER